MSEPKFTPGPWNLVFDNRNDALCIWNKEKDFLIASIALLGVKGEIEKRRFADFNLIADAWQLPDLRKEIAELKEINKEMQEALDHLRIAAHIVCDDFCSGAGCCSDATDCHLEAGLIRAEIALRKARGETE